MNGRCIRPLVGIILLCALSLLHSPRASAQLGTPELGKRMAALAAEYKAKVEKAATHPTPKGPDGHPMLTGFWLSGPDLNQAFGIQKTANGSISVSISEGGPQVGSVPLPPDPNPPPYKPELLAKVKDNDDNQTDRDPVFNCKPAGVPRVGPPLKIIANGPGEILFLYDPPEETPVFRIIPIANRKHDPNLDPTWFGDSIARWEGDTLVVDTTNFNDESWLGARGYFHSTAMHVVERLTRKGDTIQYSAVVEDPQVLTKPWSVTPSSLLLANDEQHFEDIRPCENIDSPHIVEKSNFNPPPSATTSK
jgi:hypothetical protein